jgi:Predicted exonuclease of the beta-lactamase fold involved in RNA processing
MEFVNLTRNVEIGANSYLLRTKGRTIVLDAGMHPKEEGLTAIPNYDLVPEGGVDAIIVTHAHQDHIGSLPFLTRREQQARVFMTQATARVADVMLHNSVNVMVRQREEHQIEAYPLFTHRGVEFSRTAWQPCTLRRPFDLNGERSGGDGEPSFEFYPAGHILGAAGVMIRSEGKKVFYTGDVNFENQILIRGAEFPEEQVDVLIMETTRGDSPTPPGFTRAKEEERLARAVRDAFDRGGSVTIPVFALGKTQELLAMLWRMRLRGLLAAVPIYIGGLSTKLTNLYDTLSDDPQRAHPELQLLQELAPYVLSGNEVFTIPPRKKCIFALSSGMMTENTLSNLFARRVLADPNQSLFFVGYSDPESPAGRIRSANPGDNIVLDPKQPSVKLNCHIDEFNFSAHASRESLLNYAIALRPKKIVLVHGDRPAIEWFQLKLYKELPDTEVIIPEPGQKITF